MNGIDTTAGMTMAEITLLAAQLGAGVTIIDYFFFPSVSNCLRYVHMSAIPVRFYWKKSSAIYGRSQHGIQWQTTVTS
jgi:hypothetical protein